MIQGKWFTPGTDCPEVWSIREAVFNTGKEPADEMRWNVMVMQDGVPAASGGIRWEDGSFVLERIGVLKEYRGQQLGDLTLRLLLFKAQEHFAKEVVLVSPKESEGFFERLGFRAIGNGKMLVSGEDIDLDTCKGCKKTDCPKRK